ncbi:MAG: hypothetical protein IT385_27335 [Deltaproteobacteria bacterium]|nr:hypothetical protein [Deltaproteobacteria bacterium]
MTLRHPLLVLVSTTLLGSLAACASGSDEPRPEPAVADPVMDPGPIEARPADHKVRAPVELALTAEGARDALSLTLAVRATADVPRAVARFTLPDGVTLVAGALEHELGARARGSETRVSVVVRVPADLAVTMFAGVDCHLSPGVKLYGVTRLTLGAPIVEPPVPDRIIPRDGLRATPARPRE